MSIGVVIPCYRVTSQILPVLAAIGPECTRIFIVDDACPEGTGDLVASRCNDSRVCVLRHSKNRGVGAAVITGYRQALDEGLSIIVKIDGDGQMDPTLIPLLVGPLLSGEADYTKGNRFFEPNHLKSMPMIRLLGNAALSFMTKLSSGYWTVFDPTNGFTAIHAEIARHLPMDKLAERYFFESDVLFRLALLRAKVADVPFPAHYGNERSSLNVFSSIPIFLRSHLRNFLKRIGYSYFLRDFTVASVELLCGVVLCSFGTIFGAIVWYRNAHAGILTNTGTVMIAVLPIILGIQLLIAFLSYDISSVPREAVHPALLRRQSKI